MTRTPASTSAGASSAAAASGSARNTTSASRASASGDERRDGAVPEPRQRRQPPRGAPVWPDDIAAVSATAGWRASSRSSSWPV